MDRAFERFQPDHVLCQLGERRNTSILKYGCARTLDYMDTLSKGWSGARGPLLPAARVPHGDAPADTTRT